MSNLVVVGLEDAEQARTKPVPTELPDGATVHDAIKDLLENYHDINPSCITQLTQPPSPLEFMRFVARNQPFIIRQNPGPEFQKPLKQWTSSYLCSKMGNSPVTVALTPNGKADAVHFLPSSSPSSPHLLFIKPHEVLEPFSAAVQQIKAHQAQGKDYTGPTRYIQSQNDNLHTEYSSLFADLPSGVSWASEALDQHPDAVNLWIGNSWASSALHKDHYENIFVQMRGSKEFILLPPIESPCVNERAVLSATFAPAESTPTSEADTDTDTPRLVVRIDEPGQYVPLPTWDPENATENVTEYTQYARPIRVRVDEGDVLYLPALWYHKVKQVAGDEGVCCSVNYWYDMDFSGPFQCSARFVGEVAGLGQR